MMAGPGRPKSEHPTKTEVRRHLKRLRARIRNVDRALDESELQDAQKELRSISNEAEVISAMIEARKDALT
jgi:hypothetical protein